MFVVCVFEGEDIVRGEDFGSLARWTVDIGRDSSVVEHLTSDEGVRVRFLVQPYIFICISLYLFIPPIPTTHLLDSQTVTCDIKGKRRSGTNWYWRIPGFRYGWRSESPLPTSNHIKWGLE